MKVYQDDERGRATRMDIIFVHGLRGDVDDTWTKDGVCWPRDLLKLDLPKARIMSWAWDASVARVFEYASQTTLFQNAEALLFDIQCLRDSDEHVSYYYRIFPVPVTYTYEGRTSHNLRWP